MLVIVPDLRLAEKRLDLLLDPRIEKLFDGGSRLQSVLALDVLFEPMLRETLLCRLKRFDQLAVYQVVRRAAVLALLYVSRQVRPPVWEFSSRRRVSENPRHAPFSQTFQDCINCSCETLPQQMNTVDLERLKEQEDAAIKIIDSWPRIFQLPVYRQLYAFGIRISNIDSEIEKELKKSA